MVPDTTRTHTPPGGLADLLADIDTVADSGYVGVDGIDLVPYKKPPGRELHQSQTAFNTALSPNPGRRRASSSSPEDLAHAQRGRRPLPRTGPQIPLRTESDCRTALFRRGL